MRDRSLIICLLCWWGVVGLASAAASPDVSTVDQYPDVPPMRIVVSMHPLQLMVEDLVDGLPGVDVVNLMPVNATPHDFSLSPQRMQSIRRADWVIWLGAAAEPYLVSALGSTGRAEQRQVAMLALPEVRTRFFSAESEHAAHHDHAGHNHKVGDLDPHLWWHSDNLVALAGAWVGQVTAQQPELGQFLARRFARWRDQILALRQAYRDHYHGRSLLALSYHEAFGYLTDDLGLRVADVLMRSPEIKPGARQVLQIRQLLEQGNVRCLLMEPTAQPKWLQVLDPQQQLRHVVIDPLGWDISDSEQRSMAMLATAYKKLEPCLSSVSSQAD